VADSRAFESCDVAIIERQGVLLWTARQIGAALGYDDEGRRLVSSVTGEWSSELVDGTDYQVLRGEELAALKAAAPGLVDPRAPSLLLLTESGVHLVALLSRQPAAVRLRRWLASEVLPAIHRTGRYDSALAEGPALAVPAPGPQLPVPVTAAPAPPQTLPPAPARTLGELRWRVAQLRELALAPGADALFAEAERASLLRQAASLLVVGLAEPTARADRAPRQLAIAGPQDADAPGLIPLSWAADPDLVARRYQEPCPGVDHAYREHTRADLCVEVVACAPFLSDDTLRALAHLLTQGRISEWHRWEAVYQRAAASHAPRRARGEMAS
jgi:prophage antirepressor-like protein